MYIAKHHTFILFEQLCQLLLIINLQFKCAYLFENIINIFFSVPQYFSSQRLGIKQRSSLVNLTVVTKLQPLHFPFLLGLEWRDPPSNTVVFFWDGANVHRQHCGFVVREMTVAYQL